MASMIDPALDAPVTLSVQTSVLPESSSHAVTRGNSPPLPRAPADILNDYDLAVERAQTWTGPARFGFNAMLASPDYKNKLRLRPDKMERIVFFLVTPDAKSREKDRADAQAKHQSQQWLYHHGSLYRKESRLSTPRRHVSALQAFDVLTAEHLRSGHHGRDKMLKILEAKYIGYTKDELMYILDHCTVCSSKHIRGAAARRRENKHTTDPGVEMSDEMTSTLNYDPAR